MGFSRSPLGRFFIKIRNLLPPPSGQELKDIFSAVQNSAPSWVSCSLIILLGGGYLCYLIEAQLVGTILGLHERKIIPQTILPELINIASVMCWSLLLPAYISLSTLPFRVQSHDFTSKNRAFIMLLPRVLVQSYRTCTLTIARFLALSLPLVCIWALFLFLLILNPPWWAPAIFMLLATKFLGRLAKKPFAILGTPWICALSGVSVKQALSLAAGEFRQVGYLTTASTIGIALVHFGISQLQLLPTTTPELLKQTFLPLCGFHLPWAVTSLLIAKRVVSKALALTSPQSD